MTNQFISVRGAREHNLKNVDLDLPRDSLIVMTGLSGSGKSSLAFDTIYAEGQRRYVESLSAYARQFLEMMQKPDVDQIDGLSPAISIEQKTTSRNPRSTVGTVTEIYDYMRLLFARVGVPHSAGTGLADREPDGKPDGRSESWPAGRARAATCCRSSCAAARASTARTLAEFMRKGFQRAKIDGTFHEIAEASCPRQEAEARLSTWWWTGIVGARRLSAPGWRFAGDGAQASPTASPSPSSPKRSTRPTASLPGSSSRKIRLPCSGFTIAEIEPRLFSFNNPSAPARNATVLAPSRRSTPDLVVPDAALAMKAGAIHPWAKTSSPYYHQTLEGLARHFGFKVSDSWADLPETTRQKILYGTGSQKIAFVYDDGLRSYQTNKVFEGVIPNLERRWKRRIPPG
jgi:excinuclease ABC subunit A